MKERIIKNFQKELAEYDDGPIRCQENLLALSYQMCHMAFKKSTATTFRQLCGAGRLLAPPSAEVARVNDSRRNRRTYFSKVGRHMKYAFPKTTLRKS
jgi:hypothetical protein